MAFTINLGISLSKRNEDEVMLENGGCMNVLACACLFLFKNLP